MEGAQMKTRLAVPALFAAVVTVAPLLAHHGVSRTFDAGKVTTLQGVITRVAWANPHVSISMEVKNANGAITNWSIEMAAPNSLHRDGIRPESFELNKSCSIEIWPAFDGSPHANGRKLTFADGRSFDIHDKWTDITVKPAK
jgi:hypothetical protein